MSSPLHLEVFVVAYTSIFGLLALIAESEAAWRATSVSPISGERDAQVSMFDRPYVDQPPGRPPCQR